MDYKATEYTLINVADGREFEDSGWMLDDPQSKVNSLIRTKYKKKQLHVGDESEGLYRFADWLPIKRRLKGSASPVTYKSKGLASYLGLENLYITFSGYYPEIGANMTTCSFKETEAYSVCGRLDDSHGKVLVVASAGNTARAFAKVCSHNNIPLVICVPEDNIDALWFEEPLSDCVQLVSTESGSDYFDAINLSNAIACDDLFLAEGGAKNVARRDGMATTFLSAVNFIGEIPDYYFQAIGSGTGAIAAWEANMRLNEDGRFGNKKTKLILSQNAPFLPMYNAWKAASREMLHYDDNEARHHAEMIDAKVLSNRKPPYPVIGGLYDALTDCGGDILAVDNNGAREAYNLFLELEGVDIYKAAAVATKSLITSVQEGRIPKNKIVMLNITGGGERRFQSDKEVYYMQPSLVFGVNFDKDEVISKVKQLFK